MRSKESFVFVAGFTIRKRGKKRKKKKKKERFSCRLATVSSHQAISRNTSKNRGAARKGNKFE